MNSTIKLLAEITDPGKFERLATAILRAANPETYGAICHTGVNENGKTIRAPLDNIGWATTPNGNLMVAVEHSTSKKIHDKWLRDIPTPEKNKINISANNTKGDLRKAIDEIDSVRVNWKSLHAQVALTSNREPNQKTLIEAKKLAQANNIYLDILSASRLADYLDTTPQGQWIRSLHLGSPVQIVSKELLSQCTNKQLKQYAWLHKESESVERSINIKNHNNHTFLVGASGMGKTTIALQILKQHLKKNGTGIILSPESISESTNIADAIDRELRKWEPSLRPGSGSEAIELGSAQQPFLLVIEDANKAVNPIGTLEKAIKWIAAENNNPSPEEVAWRIVCPMWHQHIDALESNSNIIENIIIQEVGLYTDQEARTAICRRAISSGVDLSPSEESHLAAALNNDPLLIGLYQFPPSQNATDVVEEYIEKCLRRVAFQSNSFSYSELLHAIKCLIRLMLEQRKLSPEWLEVRNWLSNDTGIFDALRLLSKHSSIYSNKTNGTQETIMFRHDRILFSLMSLVVADALQEINFEETEYLSDPFYAEAVGAGILKSKASKNKLEKLIKINPLALFHAFFYGAKSSMDLEDIRITLEDWLQSGAATSKKFQSLRMQALRLLSETDAPEVLKLTNFFSETDRYDDWCQARFRNGDLWAGINLLTMLPFDITIPGQSEVIEHVRNHYGANLIRAVSNILNNEELSDRASRGALYLAGYIGSPLLQPAITRRWKLDQSEHMDLVSFFWASTRCYEKSADTILPAVCDRLSSHPNLLTGDELQNLSKNNLAGAGIERKLDEFPINNAIPYLIERAEMDESLHYSFANLLRGIDSPLVVTFIARYLSKNGAVKSFGFLDSWRDRDKRGAPMSKASKKKLMETVTNEESPIQLKQAAFDIWEKTVAPDDLADIKDIAIDSRLQNRLIWARARRGDETVVKELLLIIPENPAYWWQAGRYLWTAEMTQALRDSIATYCNLNQNKPHAYSNTPHILAERLTSLNKNTAESILIAEWEKINKFYPFVRAAIYLNTTELKRRVKNLVKESENPKSYFEHISVDLGIGFFARGKRITHSLAMELINHIDLLSSNDLLLLWREFEHNNWQGRERRHLYNKVKTLADYKKHQNKAMDLSYFDDSLKGIFNPGIERWIEEHEIMGFTRPELIQALCKWLNTHRTQPALYAVLHALSCSANRADIDISWNIDEVANAADMIENMRFAVMHRTLQ